jgi:hypothetical protein
MVSGVPIFRKFYTVKRTTQEAIHIFFSTIYPNNIDKIAMLMGSIWPSLG